MNKKVFFTPKYKFLLTVLSSTISFTFIVAPSLAQSLFSAPCYIVNPNGQFSDLSYFCGQKESGTNVSPFIKDSQTNSENARPITEDFSSMDNDTSNNSSQVEEVEQSSSQNQRSVPIIQE